jgi:hypothetical protein
MAIRRRSCAPCHASPQHLGGFDYVLDDAKLTTLTSATYINDAGMPWKMIAAGDPAHSWVYQRIVTGEMPPASDLVQSLIGPQAAANLVRPSAADQSALYTWILCLGTDGGDPFAGNYGGATYGPTPVSTSSGSSGSGSGVSSSGGGSSGSSSSGVTSSGGTSSGGSSGSSSGVTSSSGSSSGGSSSSSGSSSGSSSSSSGVVDAGCGVVDPAQYNFERFTQRWMGNGAPIAGVMTSTTEVFAGCQSLAVDFNGAAGTTQVQVFNPSTEAGRVVTFHVWIPSGSAITSVQPFVIQGADAGFRFTGTFEPIGNLTVGAWNTITVQVPNNAVTPLDRLGVEFVTNAMWTGTVYIDSVGW